MYRYPLSSLISEDLFCTCGLRGLFFFFSEVLLIPRKMWSHLLIKTVLLLPLSLSQRVNRRKVSVAQRGAQLSSGSFAANINSI